VIYCFSVGSDTVAVGGFSTPKSARYERRPESERADDVDSRNQAGKLRAGKLRAGMLIPIASLFLVALPWIPVAVCSAMPGCPMTAAHAAGIEGSGGCHPASAPESDSCDSSRITELPCCGVTRQPAPPVAREISVPSSPSPPVVAAPIEPVVLAVAPSRPVSFQTPAPKTFGRDLLSRHQAFLL
jgi:hypothetical protein